MYLNFYLGLDGCVVTRNNSDSFDCTRGLSTWAICSKSAKEVRCIQDDHLAKTEGQKWSRKQFGQHYYKNITFECEMCYMADSSNFLVNNTDPKASQRCRTEELNPVLKRPVIEAFIDIVPEHFCLGERRFKRYIPCNYHSEKKWSQACLLSSKIFLLDFSLKFSFRRRFWRRQILSRVLGFWNGQVTYCWWIRLVVFHMKMI